MWIVIDLEVLKQFNLIIVRFQKCFHFWGLLRGLFATSHGHDGHDRLRRARNFFKYGRVRTDLSSALDGREKLRPRQTWRRRDTSRRARGVARRGAAFRALRALVARARAYMNYRQLIILIGL